MFNVEWNEDQGGSLPSFNIEHFTFNIQHLLSEPSSRPEHVAAIREENNPRIAKKTTPGCQTAAPSQPDVGQGCRRTRVPPFHGRPSKGDTPEPGVPARGADTRGCRRFTAGVRAGSRRETAITKTALREP